MTGDPCELGGECCRHMSEALWNPPGIPELFECCKCLKIGPIPTGVALIAVKCVLGLQRRAYALGDPVE